MADVVGIRIRATSQWGDHYEREYVRSNHSEGESLQRWNLYCLGLFMSEFAQRSNRVLDNGEMEFYLDRVFDWDSLVVTTINQTDLI